jgi:acetylornithine deacetylase/succinyl-diaminopimelate desuccinylase-like protein
VNDPGYQVGASSAGSFLTSVPMAPPHTYSHGYISAVLFNNRSFPKHPVANISVVEVFSVIMIAATKFQIGVALLFLPKEGIVMTTHILMKPELDRIKSLASEDRAYFESGRKALFKEWARFLEFKSISTDPAFHEDCLACVQWLAGVVAGLGFEVEILPTEGKPLLYAIRPGDSDRPTVLYYGHYDVQPVGILELWESDPFVATERRRGDSTSVFARGAQDNKGQTFYVLKALERLIAQGALKNTVKLLIEGEEECGSPGLDKKLPSLADKVTADILLACDSGGIAPTIPMVTVGLRGSLSLEIKVRGASDDLHSGVHGGVVKNPAFELARVLGSMHDSQGRVTIPGFYDGVELLSSEESERVEQFPITRAIYEQMVGMPASGGEQRYSLPVRRGLRPCIDITGMCSGYTGAGFASIIPSEARVKLGIRVVPGQNERGVLDAVISYIKSNTAPEFKVTVEGMKTIGGAFRSSPDEIGIRVACEVIEALSSAPAVLCWEGASIPIIAALVRTANARPVIVGYGLQEDNIHAPNESFSWEQLQSGFLFVTSYFRIIGSLDPGVLLST